MSTTYYVRIRGRVHGPMEMPRLQSLAAKGQLSRIHDISDDGQSWRKASTMPEIFERRAASVTTAGASRMAAVKESRQPNQETASAATASSGAESTASSGGASGSSGLPPGGDTAAWHYSINGMQYGPVSKMDLGQLVKNNSLAPDDLVWKEGMASWGEAGNVGELAGLFRGVKTNRRSGGGGSDENLTDPMRRLLARVIDRMVVLLAIGISVLLMLLILMALGVSMNAADAAGGPSNDGAAAVVGALTLGAILAWAAAIVLPIGIVGAIQIYLLTTYSQSIGKRLLKMQIVRMEDDQPAGFGNAFFLRSFCNNLIGTMLFFTFGAYFIIDACFIFRDDRRCIHDLLAKTKVIDID